jgi:hypothetical protein
MQSVSAFNKFSENLLIEPGEKFGLAVVQKKMVRSNS